MLVVALLRVIASVPVAASDIFSDEITAAEVPP